jgi:ppGpp synthetase/RelA/SpoT-type nucleotidyltranferase
LRTHRDILPEYRLDDSAYSFVPVIGGARHLSWWEKMAFATPQHSRNQVDKAGMLLADYWNTDNLFKHKLEDTNRAFEIVNNWRAAHNFPLNNFQMNLRAKVKRIQSDVLVAQRIKRLESIVTKLLRGQTSTMQLSQMQDIGGCRAIVSSVANVSKLVESYERSTFAHKLRGEKNYISTPKPDGYRGHHLIYQYQGLPNQYKDYDNLRIEIQIRSQLQHAWATAVEAVGLFTKQALKSNQGSQEWLRLFMLMSSVIADIEKTAPIPGVSDSLSLVRAEIAEIAKRIYAVPTLEAHRATLNWAGTRRRELASKYLLVRFDHAANKVNVNDFAPHASQVANAAYTEAEKSKKDGDSIVLVKVDSIRSLTRAYPNFFLDTKTFADLLKEVLREHELPPVINP